MAKRRRRRRLQGGPRNTGPTTTARPVPLMTPQCCTHWLGVKCVQADACLCRAANRPCMSGCSLENCFNWGPTWALTAAMLTINTSQITKESQEAALTLCQFTPPVVFHPDAPDLSTRPLTRVAKWSALTARADTAHADPALTKTAATDPTTPAAIGSGKINSNRAQPTDGKTASPGTPANPDSEFMLAAGFSIRWSCAI